MDVVPLAPFGAELRGVDLARELPGPERAAIARAWRDHRLLLVRDQDLTGDQQVRFATLVGPLFRYGGYAAWQGDWGFVSNQEPTGALRTGPLLFHSDHAFEAEPLKAICLHALAVPASGGSTRFVDGCRAFEALPAGLRDRIRGRTAVHVFDLGDPAGDRAHRIATAPPTARRAEHPVAWPHPETGRPILYVSGMQTDHVVGLRPAESRALLDDLLAVLYREDAVLEHRWRPGDVVLWDNRALQHARADFDPAEARTLRRVTIAEDHRPAGAA